MTGSTWNAAFGVHAVRKVDARRRRYPLRRPPPSVETHMAQRTPLTTRSSLYVVAVARRLGVAPAARGLSHRMLFSRGNTLFDGTMATAARDAAVFGMVETDRHFRTRIEHGTSRRRPGSGESPGWPRHGRRGSHRGEAHSPATPHAHSSERMRSHGANAMSSTAIARIALTSSWLILSSTSRCKRTAGSS